MLWFRSRFKRKWLSAEAERAVFVREAGAGERCVYSDMQWGSGLSCGRVYVLVVWRATRNNKQSRTKGRGFSVGTVVEREMVVEQKQEVSSRPAEPMARQAHTQVQFTRPTVVRPSPSGRADPRVKFSLVLSRSDCDSVVVEGGFYY